MPRRAGAPDQHYVPAGMCARVVAKNLGTLRQITFASNGDLVGVLAGGAIKVFHDANGDGVFDAGEITTFGGTGGNGNNCHVDEPGGHLYCGSPDGVVRFAFVAGDTTGGQAEPVVTGQPGDGNHPKHTVHVYDGYLYVHSGSSGNASNSMSPAYDTDRALLRRFNLASFNPATPFDWQSGEIVSQGLRNMVGYTRNAAGRMYGVVNGLDDVHYMGSDVHQDNPGEQVVALGMGKSFGYPFCFTAQRVVANGQAIMPGTQLLNQDFPSGLDDAWCAQHSTPPATFIQAHSAPLDIVFFDAQSQGGAPGEVARGRLHRPPRIVGSRRRHRVQGDLGALRRRGQRAHAHLGSEHHHLPVRDGLRRRQRRRGQGRQLVLERRHHRREPAAGGRGGVADRRRALPQQRRIRLRLPRGPRLVRGGAGGPPCWQASRWPRARRRRTRGPSICRAPSRTASTRPCRRRTW